MVPVKETDAFHKGLQRKFLKKNFQDKAELTLATISFNTHPE